MKSIVFTGIALAVATLGLSACGSGGGDPAVEVSPDGFPGIEVSNARLVLPAVKGNPGAAYFDIDYGGDDAAMIRAASVAGAESAMMHVTATSTDGTSTMQDLPQIKVDKGETLKFAPGGNHVMVMGLPETLKAGDDVEITLTFVGGDKTSFPAKVRPAGEAD